MPIRKALSSSSFLVFPLAVLLVYWEYTYFRGRPVEQTIPSFSIFVGLAVLLVLEAIFRCEKGASQRRLSLRDIASTAVNALYTGTVATTPFVPIVVFLPELILGRSVFFAASEQLGPVWLQFILAMLLYD
jgi:hypothetical protein